MTVTTGQMRYLINDPITYDTACATYLVIGPAETPPKGSLACDNLSINKQWWVFRSEGNFLFSISENWLLRFTELISDQCK